MRGGRGGVQASRRVKNMDYAPPGRVVRVCESRWSRWVIKDGSGEYWTGGRWSDKPSDAMLFHTQITAMEACNRHCLGGDTADTFTATIVLTVHANCWSVEELAAWLKRHRKLCIGGYGRKRGLLLEILPDTLKKVEP
jgi:hypothetical protein